MNILKKKIHINLKPDIDTLALAEKIRKIDGVDSIRFRYNQ